MRSPVLAPGFEWLANSIEWSLNRNKPSYYDSPANKDLLRKSMISTRNATITAMNLGLMDAILINGYKQIIPALSRVLYWGLPSFGSFGAFILGNALAVNLNGGKDTAPCHAVGGFLFMSVWVAHLKRPRLLWFAAIPAAALMSNMKKYRDMGIMQNFVDVKRDAPDYVGTNIPYNMMDINWSLIKNFDLKQYDKEE